jgi:hypothetical protein
MDFLNDQRRGLLVQVVEHPLQLIGGPVPLANPHEEPLIPRFQVCPPRHGAPILVTVSSLSLPLSKRLTDVGSGEPPPHLTPTCGESHYARALGAVERDALYQPPLFEPTQGGGVGAFPRSPRHGLPAVDAQDLPGTPGHPVRMGGLLVRPAGVAWILP